MTDAVTTRLTGDDDKSPSYAEAFISGPSCYLIEDMLLEMKTDCCALVYADIDHFRALNSAMGYRTGDKLISRSMELIDDNMDDNIGIYRLGSGFFIILPELSKEEIESQCLAINKALLKDSMSNKSGVIVTLSFGVSWHYANEDPAIALAEAEDVCRKMKEIGPGGISVLSERVHGHNQLAEHMVTLRSIHDALTDGRMTLFAQPIGNVKEKLANVDSPNKRFEVLIRMKGKDGHIIPPDSFLPVAERYGLITEIDKWVVTSVINYMASHSDIVSEMESYAINISGKSINDPSFMSFIIDSLEGATAPNKMCFEITETALVSDMTSAKNFVENVGKFGSKVSLDDFGTGLCSFGYLKNINADYVKIDGSFIRSITTNSSDLAMVKAITDIGHVLGKRVVGEFVTDQATLNMLGAIGVDYAQGYYIGRPIPLI